jgi:hypothetical protein
LIWAQEVPSGWLKVADCRIAADDLVWATTTVTFGPNPTLARVEVVRLNFPKAAIQIDRQKYALRVSRAGQS